MAKAGKKSKSEGRSVLQAAWAAFERGDVVQARSLAKEVLAGRVGPDDPQIATELAGEMSTAAAPVDASPQAVAQELIKRTGVPPKAYVFAAAVAAVLILLVVLAALRYRGN